MAQAQGSRGRLAFQAETTFKADPASPDMKLIHFASESLQYKQEAIMADVITGARQPTRAIRGNADVTGSITTRLQAFQLGSLVKAALGSCTTTGAGPYVHTLKIGGTLPSLVIEKGFTDIGQYFKYNGCKVNSLKLSTVPAGWQEVAFDIIGCKETVSGTAFDATPTDAGFKPFDGFDVSASGVLEGGSAIATVTRVDFSIENDLDNSVYVIGGAGERGALPEGVAKVSGTMTAMFESLALYDKAKNDTTSSLKVIWQKGTGAGSAGNEYFEILVPALTYSPNAPVINGPKGVVVELPFVAYTDATYTDAIICTLKNTEATL